MIDIGMPTLIETNTLDECAELCHMLGLQFIELNMNLPQYQIGIIDIPHFNAVAKHYNIYYSIHLDESLNVSDFNPYIVEAYRRTVRETIIAAKQLSVPILNMHLSQGVYFTLPDKKVFLFDEYKEQYLESIAVFRDECEKAVGESDIIICVENSDGYTAFQTDAINLLLQSPVFGLTFDIGHNHAINGTDEHFILKHTDRLCHMHMHDALGKKNHLALGTGELDLQSYLALANVHNCRIVLETKTVAGLTQSAEWMTCRNSSV